MVVSCRINSIHIGSRTGIVLHEFSKIVNIVNLSAVTVCQPSLVMVMETCPRKRHFIFWINFVQFTPVSDVTKNGSSMSLLNQMFNCLLVFYLDYFYSWLQFKFLSINKVVVSLNFLFIKILRVCVNGR